MLNENDFCSLDCTTNWKYSEQPTQSAHAQHRFHSQNFFLLFWFLLFYTPQSTPPRLKCLSVSQVREIYLFFSVFNVVIFPLKYFSASDFIHWRNLNSLSLACYDNFLIAQFSRQPLRIFDFFTVALSKDLTELCRFR